MPVREVESMKSWVSGIITAWYGMNIPNRKKVKTRLAPGKRHFERTKPFSEPRIVEMTVAGMTSLKLFARARATARVPGLSPRVERPDVRQRPRVARSVSATLLEARHEQDVDGHQHEHDEEQRARRT